MTQMIRNRQTLKVLADLENPWPPPAAEFDDTINELLDLAAHGPYHYVCDPVHQTESNDSPAPWRFYALNGATARTLLTKIANHEIPLGNIGPMLAAADGLILATWLPDPPQEDTTLGMQSYEPTHRNMEHIAAGAAAIQNLLLGATEKGINNYWSSGGSILRSEGFYQMLGIPTNQVLLGAIFLFPQDTRDAATKPGANRGRCGERQQWSKWVTLD